jgi:hypothetical protein
MTTNYQKFKGPDNIVLENYIKRLPDNAFIPFDPGNTDYQQYLEWLAEGNTVLPADEPNNG